MMALRMTVGRFVRNLKGKTRRNEVTGKCQNPPRMCQKSSYDFRGFSDIFRLFSEVIPKGVIRAKLLA